MWARIAGHAAPLVGGMAGIAACWWWAVTGSGVLFDVAFLTLLSASCAALIVWVYGFGKAPSWAMPVQWTARISYSLYLVHLTVFDGWPGWSEAGPVVGLALMLGATLAAALLLHVLVEQPGMALREKLWRKLPAAAG